MIRISSLVVFATLSLSLSAQTIYKITNVSITDGEKVQKAMDVTATIKGAEGSDRVMIFASQEITLESKVKVSTQNVARSSLKSSAVNATFEIDLRVAGKKDNRRVEKIYYMDQERKSHFSEKFVFKNGNQVRVIVVEFDGSLE